MNTWYAAGKSGIFKSTDGGATWTTSLALADCNPFDPGCGGDSLQPSREPGTVYAIATSSIVKSTDSGATWNPVNPPTSGPLPASYVRLDPFHPGHLFTAGFRGSYRSFDDGANWTTYTTPGFSPQYCGMTPPAFDPVRENLVYVIDHCAVYRSNDAGLNWNLVDTPFHNPINIDTTATGAIFVRDIAGLWVSTDATLSWNLLLSFNPTQSPPSVFLAQDPNNPNVILTINQRTDDGGATWTPLTLGRQINAAVFDPSYPGRVIAATDGAAAGFIAKLGYGGDIMAATYIDTPGSTTIAGVATDPAGNIYIAGGRGNQTYFAAKYDNDLNSVYSIVLPGYTYVNGIAVDPTGAAAILGFVPPQPQAQSPCLVTKLAPDGSISFRTMLSTGDSCSSIAADSAGNTVVAISSFQPTLTKLDANGSIVFSQSVNRINRFGAQSLATDSAGSIYLAGTTSAKDYQTTDGAYQSKVSSNCAYPSSAINTGIIGTVTTNDNSDTFVQKLDPNGSLIWSTLLGGGCLDLVNSIAVDGAGNVWLAGRTNSSPFPQVSEFESGPAYSYYKAFVSEFDPNGTSLKLSSYLTAGDSPLIATDTFGNTYVAGSTTPPLFYISGPCCAAPPKNVHASLTKLQTVAAAPLAITAAGNAFSLRNGPVSAGQITLIAATGLTPDTPQDLTLTPTDTVPRSLSGVQVLFDGEAAPIVSVTAGRVVAVAPYTLANKQTTSIQLAFNGTLSAPVIADVLTDYAFLSRDGSGTGQAVAFNPDGTPNSSDNPAPQNAMVTVFATGVGVVPSCAAGSVDNSTGYLCGIVKTAIRTPNYAVSTAILPNSALTVAVK
jgi:uncharacterized protein (TIGR03437 family)